MRRWRDSLPSMAKIWDLNLRRFKVHIKETDIIYFFNQMVHNKWVPTWLVNCNWSRNSAPQRTKLGTKSVSSSCVCLVQPGLPRGVSWTRINVSIWSKVRTSPRTSACSSKTHRCEPTTRRPRTTTIRATSGKLNRWEKKTRKILVKFQISQVILHF